MKVCLSIIAFGIAITILGAILPNSTLAYETFNTSTYEMIPFTMEDQLFLKVLSRETRHNSFLLILGYAISLTGIFNIIINSAEIIINYAKKIF